MPRPKTRLPWTQQTSDTKFKKSLLTRAIRANENRARHSRAAEEQAYHLAWAGKLTQARDRL